MPVREFTDAAGREWRAWDIKPEAIHPVTRGEDYLVDCYVTGWLVFETKDGSEKRRLCPWPIGWIYETDRGLRRLLSMAELVPPRRLDEQRRLVGDVAPTPPRADEADVTDLDVVRTFRYPGGRYWTACVIMHPESGGPPVLRFVAGTRYIDLLHWPKDWSDRPDEALIEMLRGAAPRPESRPPDPETPRRRWDDAPSTAA